VKEDTGKKCEPGKKEKVRHQTSRTRPIISPKGSWVKKKKKKSHRGLKDGPSKAPTRNGGGK